jgi:acetyltransferase-like isoleucine patch superfamily enzyme
VVQEAREDGAPWWELLLLRALRALWRRLARGKLARHRRLVAAGDLLVDREERARLLGFGEGSTVYDNVLVIGQVTVGRETWVGPNVVLDGSGGLTVGSHCSISAGVQLYTHDSVAWATSGGAEPCAQASTVVEDRCYLGPNTVVAKGVRIGAGSVVGANSFVNRDLPPGSRVAGNPARPL